MLAHRLPPRPYEALRGTTLATAESSETRPGRAAPSRFRDERGAASAELAMVLPLLVAVTMGLVWLLSVGAAQLQVVDAAREAARAAARGDSVAEAAAMGAQVAPTGSRIDVTTANGRVTATAVGEVAGPGGLFDFLPSVTVSAQAVAVDEAVMTGS